MTIPALFRVAMALLPTALAVFLVGFGSTMWIRVDGGGFNFGLWMICFDGTGCRSYNFGGHVYFARAATIAGLICTVLSFVFLMLFCFKSATSTFANTSYSTAFTAGGMVFLGSVVFIAREKSGDNIGAIDVSWGGILCILSAFVMIAAGVCVLLPVKRGQVEYQTA